MSVVSVSTQLRTIFKSQLNLVLGRFHLELRSTRPILNWQSDVEFNSLYDRAMEKTQMTSSDNVCRRQRHYMLRQLLSSLGSPKNAVVECGCWRGLSSYQICHYLKGCHDQGFHVEFHVFDSFKGLSDPGIEDMTTVWHVTPVKRGFLGCPLPEVQRNLSEFDFVMYHEGWIPEKFPAVEDRIFSFVHIDVDLYQPIKDAVEFFYPRLDSAGMIVFDDYGYLQFPGACKAVEEFVKKEGCPCIRLTTGQAVIYRRGSG